MKILDFSTLNRWDKLMLECSIIAKYNESFNCGSCMNVKDDEIESNKILRETKGCFTRKKNPIVRTDTGTEMFMCPGRLYGANQIFLINEYDHYKHSGSYANGLSLNMQSSKTIESFNFIESEIIKNERSKERENKANGK